MSHVFPHSDRRGTNAALDLVEETLASLRKRVEKQQQQEKGSKVKDAATNTMPPPPPPPSVTSSKGSKKPRNKSVLIKRKTKYKGKRTRHASNSSTQEKAGTQVFEEKVAQDYCRHCYPRSEGSQSRASNVSQESRRVTRPPRREPKLPRERITWKHGERGHKRKDESEDSSPDCLCHDKTCRPVYTDSDPADVRKRVIWKHGKRSYKRKEESEDSSQDCLCLGNTCRPLYGDQDARRKVIMNPGKRGERRREDLEHSTQDCLCYSNTCVTQGPARHLHGDPQHSGVREELPRHGRRGHSRREESHCSCHSNRQSSSSPKPRQTAQEEKSTDIGGRATATQKSREHKASGQELKHNKQPKGKERKAATHPRPPADVESQGYAQPTHASRLRTDQLQRRKKEKENIIPYIPCGAKSHSYHVGVIAQQEMGRLINQPLHEHTHTHTRLQSGSQREGVAATSLMEETVKQAMANIHHHLTGHTEHHDPHL